MTGLSRRSVALAVAARLAAVTNATGYLGQIDAMCGLPGVVSTPADPPVKDPGVDERVTPYFIVEPGTGRPGTATGVEDSVAGPVDPFRDTDQLYTIRVAAGDVEDLLALVDRIDARLRPPAGWSPVVDGVRCGFLIPQPGYDPPLLPDNATTPARFFTPLQYRLTTHT